MCKNSLFFNSDGNFRILQIADAQELHFVNPDTVKLIRLSIEKAKPDLVVFTGDQIYGLIPTFKGKTEEKVRHVIRKLLQPLEENNIPFAVTFGNHDAECGISNAKQMEIYMESPLCIGGSYANGRTTGLFSLPIYGKTDKIALNLYLFDTKGQNGIPSGVDAAQLEVYRQTRDTLKDKNDGCIPSLVFQHIPPIEIMEVIEEVPKRTKGAVEAYGNYADRFFKLPQKSLARGDFMGESPAVPKAQSGQVDALLEKGDVFGIYFGHDHINSFVLPYKGIALGYTQGTGFNVYGPGKKRGVRIFDIPEENPRNYTTHTLTFGELTKDHPINIPFELAMPLIPTSVLQVKKQLKTIVLPTVLACTTAVITAFAIAKCR